MVDHETWSEEQRRTTVSVDGHELGVAYHEAGRDDGVPVVLLHGIPTWSFLWRDVVSAVSERRRTIAPDMLGYGNSAMHDGFDRSIRAQESMLESLLDDLDVEAVSIVAHDIGGGVALRFAAHHPERVEQLVLSNAVCYDSWPVEFISGLGLPETAELDRDELDAQLETAFAGGAYGDADPEFVEGMKAPWLTDEGRTSLARNAVATNTNHTTEIDYGAITADTLLLWAEDDAMQPYAYAERLADDLRSAELAPLSDAYHWVVEDRTEAYCEAVTAFLRG